VLGVRPGASAAEIRAAYRRHSVEHHPDHGGDPATFLAGQDAYQRLVRNAGDRQDTNQGSDVIFHRRRSPMRTIRRALTVTTHRIARRPIPPPRVQ
jgi:curved DNA-binding protein CbpA